MSPVDKESEEDYVWEHEVEEVPAHLEPGAYTMSPVDKESEEDYVWEHEVEEVPAHLEPGAYTLSPVDKESDEDYVWEHEVPEESVPDHLKPEAYLKPPDAAADGDIDDNDQMMMLNGDAAITGWGSPEPEQTWTSVETIEVNKNLAAERGKLERERAAIAKERAELELLRSEQGQREAVTHFHLGSSIDIVIPCDDCEEGEEDESSLKCVECGLNFCEAHAEVHKKAKRSKTHTLVMAGTPCDDCEEGEELPSTMHCPTCELNFCQAHADTHKKAKRSKTHKLIPMSEVQATSEGYVSDGSGTFDLEGNIEAMFAASGDLSLRECLAKGMSETTFREIDADGNGSLSQDEYREWAARKAHSDGYISDEFNVEADIGSLLAAGDLTLEECLAHGMTEKLFRQIDADNNGSLSKAEFAEWRKLSGKSGSR